MIKNFLNQLRHWWISLTKTTDDLIDVFTAPKNEVKIFLRDATTGKIVREIKGRNIVTDYIDSSNPTNITEISGRDFLRRAILNDSGGLSGVSIKGRYINSMVLGSGTDQESVSDTGLDNSWVAEPSGRQTIGTTSGTDVILSSTSPDVTFVCVWPSGVLTGKQIAEIGLFSNSDDFIARKTFPPFTKTADFSIEIQWTLRF